MLIRYSPNTLSKGPERPDLNTNLFGKATAAIVILVSGAFLTAFAFGVPATPDLMAPWSAVAFSVIGLTLWIAPDPRAERFAFHRIAAILIFGIGAVVCGEHLL